MYSHDETDIVWAKERERENERARARTKINYYLIAKYSTVSDDNRYVFRFVCRCAYSVVQVCLFLVPRLFQCPICSGYFCSSSFNLLTFSIYFSSGLSVYIRWTRTRAHVCVWVFLLSLLFDFLFIYDLFTIYLKRIFMTKWMRTHFCLFITHSISLLLTHTHVERNGINLTF